jgi:hypothetical protein
MEPHRRRLHVLTLRATSLVEAHGELGARIRKAAHRAVRARIAKTPPERLAVQLTQTAACRTFLSQLSRARRVPRLVRESLEEYLACLDAWGASVFPPGSRPLFAKAASEWALWAQDDNAGCQTGMLRRTGGSVVLWHTEEDTIGFLDEPRVALFSLGEGERGAFVYPYLLPGPAFGWGAGQLHAVDSLHTRRDVTLGGTLSGVASWLVWRIGRAMEARDVLLSLAPFVDGCAIHVVGSGAHVIASTHEIAGRAVLSRVLGRRPGSVTVQVNTVSARSGPVAREEEMSARTHALYERRLQRMRDGVAHLPSGADPSGEEVLRMLASRRGGSYAYANRDVGAHAVATFAVGEGLAMHVGGGPAAPGDVYRPRFVMPAVSHGGSHGRR